MIVPYNICNTLRIRVCLSLFLIVKEHFISHNVKNQITFE